MYKDLYRTCTAIVLIIKPFVWRRSCFHRRRGLLKFPTIAMSTPTQASLVYFAIDYLKQPMMTLFCMICWFLSDLKDLNRGRPPRKRRLIEEPQQPSLHLGKKPEAW